MVTRTTNRNYIVVRNGPGAGPPVQVGCDQSKSATCSIVSLYRVAYTDLSMPIPSVAPFVSFQVQAGP